MGHFEMVIHRLSRYLTWLSVSALGLIVLLICTNIVTRLFGRPIFGTFDTSRLLGAVVAAFALAFNAVLQGNIRVDLLVKRFPPRSQAVIDSITCLMSLGICSLIVWGGILQANTWWRTGQVWAALNIPVLHPLGYGIAFCFTVLCLVLLIDLSKSLAMMVKK